MKLRIALLALRETCNATTGVSPWFLAFGRNMRAPCQILKESWLEDQILPLKMGSDSCQYLADLKADLESAQSYAQCHSEKARSAYVERYNRRSCDKSFQVGESVLILSPDSTISKVSRTSSRSAIALFVSSRTRWQAVPTACDQTPKISL